MFLLNPEFFCQRYGIYSQSHQIKIEKQCHFKSSFQLYQDLSILDLRSYKKNGPGLRILASSGSNILEPRIMDPQKQLQIKQIFRTKDPTSDDWGSYILPVNHIIGAKWNVLCFQCMFLWRKWQQQCWLIIMKKTVTWCNFVVDELYLYYPDSCNSVSFLYCPKDQSRGEIGDC